MRKAVFLDRDGVINRGFGRRPPNSVDEFEMLPEVPEAIAMLQEAGFEVFVVTNQGGVGLGHMTKETLSRIHDRMQDELGSFGTQVHDIAACTHRPDEGCSCRKPQPGMLLRLAADHHIDMSGSYMVGDRETDILAGILAGVRPIFIGSKAAAPSQALYNAETLYEAAEFIVSTDTSDVDT